MFISKFTFNIISLESGVRVGKLKKTEKVANKSVLENYLNKNPLHLNSNMRENIYRTYS